MSKAHQKADRRENEEGVFMSMTDMFVGLIFIFLLLLVYVAMQLKQTNAQLQQTTKDIVNTDDTRGEILERLQTSLRERGVKVQIDTREGIIRLPDAILFDSARDEIKPDGQRAIEALALSLSEILPCYVDGVQKPAQCPQTPHRIATIFVEGHTDSDALTGSARLRDNWDLSAARATNTYRALISTNPGLETFKWRTADGVLKPIFSVSGYADRRPVDSRSTPAAKEKNRRIDLRVVMAGPSLELAPPGPAAMRGRQ